MNTKFKTLTEAEQTIKSRLADAAKDADTARAKIAEADGAIKAALDKMERATFEGQEMAYQQAQAELDRAQHLKEYQTKRFEALTAKQLITQDDYTRLCDGVFKEFEELDAETREHLAELSDKMTEIAKEYKAALERFNAALFGLQTQLYKNADGVRAKYGQMVVYPGIKKEVKGARTLVWAECALRNPWYREHRSIPGVFSEKELNFDE